MTVSYLQCILLWVFLQFSFLPGCTKETVMLYAQAIVAGLPSAPYTVSQKIHKGMRAVAAQPRATQATEKLVCQWTIREEFLISAKTRL